MTVSVSACPLPILAIVGNDGAPLANGSILTQVASVNYPTYQDAAGTIALQNPIPLNSRGEVSDSNGNSQQLFLVNGVIYQFTYFDGPNGSGNQIGNPQYVIGQGPTATSIGNALYPVLAAEGSSVINVWLPYGWITRYGADPANADNQPYIVAALATGLDITIPPGTFLVGSPIIQTVTGQNIQWYGTLKATQTWISAAQVATTHNNILNLAGTTINGGGTINNCVFSHNGTLSSIDLYASIMIDGSINNAGTACLADGYQAEGQSAGGRTRLRGTANIIHTPNFQYALDSAFQGDSQIEDANGQQWLTTDSQFGQANTTSIGVVLNRGDCLVTGGNLRWNVPSAYWGAYSANSGFINAHPYEGGGFANAGSSAAWTDPVVGFVHERSSGCWASDIYLDQGNWIIKSADFHLGVELPFQFTSSAIFGQDTGQPTPNLIKLYCANHPAADAIRIKGVNKFMAASNPGVGNSLPTSPIGYYPSDAITLLTLTGNGTTGSATYTATTDFAPQTNLECFITGATSASFNKVITAGAFTAGRRYQILTVGSTDYTLIGAVVNAVGHVFTATGVGAGTGTAYEAYVITSASQTAGGAGVGVVTINFLTSVNATASVAGSIQRTWHCDMNGTDSVTNAVFGASTFEDFELISSKVFMSYSASQPQMVWGTPQSTYEHLVKCGNGLSIVSFYGNLSGANPYIKHNIQQLQLNFSGGTSVAFNLAGCSVGDDGSDNIIIKTNSNTVMKLYADGGVTIGTPTGASKGAGTLNVQGGIWVNGTAVTVP